MKTIFIDTREPDEFADDHVDGAINIPPADLMNGMPEELKDVPKDTQLILYCRSGARSNTSMQILRQHGFTNMVNGINQRQVETRYL